MVHQSFRIVLSVEHTKFGVKPHVGAFCSKTALEQIDELLVVAVLLVVVNEGFEVVGLHDDLQTSDAGQSELLASHASKSNFFPDLGDICFLSCIEGLLEFSEVDKSRGEHLIVANRGVEDLASFIHSVVVASVSYLLNVGLVGPVNEVLDFCQLLSFGKSVDELTIDHRFFLDLSGHSKELDEFDVGVLAFSGSDDSHVLVRVVGFAERVD